MLSDQVLEHFAVLDTEREALAILSQRRSSSHQSQVLPKRSDVLEDTNLSAKHRCGRRIANLLSGFYKADQTLGSEEKDV